MYVLWGIYYEKNLLTKGAVQNISALSHVGGVVQLVRTLACHARGRGFESRRSRHLGTVYYKKWRAFLCTVMVGDMYPNIFTLLSNKFPHF